MMVAYQLEMGVAKRGAPSWGLTFALPVFMSRGGGDNTAEITFVLF